MSLVKKGNMSFLERVFNQTINEYDWARNILISRNMTLQPPIGLGYRLIYSRHLSSSWTLHHTQHATCTTRNLLYSYASGRRSKS